MDGPSLTGCELPPLLLTVGILFCPTIPHSLSLAFLPPHTSIPSLRARSLPSLKRNHPIHICLCSLLFVMKLGDSCLYCCPLLLRSSVTACCFFSSAPLPGRHGLSSEPVPCSVPRVSSQWHWLLLPVPPFPCLAM